MCTYDHAVQHYGDVICEYAYSANMLLQPRCNAGSEHIGCLIGKRFSGKMYLGQCIAWLPEGSAENYHGTLDDQDEYKVIFHDNDVHLLSHVDLRECKKNLKPGLTTAKNLKALKGYVEVWQQTYDRVVEQAVAGCSGKVDNQQQEAQFFPATIREVKGDGFFFVSWDDGYGLDRTKCAFELEHPQFREGKVWACTISLYSLIRFSSLLLTIFFLRARALVVKRRSKGRQKRLFHCSRLLPQLDTRKGQKKLAFGSNMARGRNRMSWCREREKVIKWARSARSMMLARVFGCCLMITCGTTAR